MNEMPDERYKGKSSFLGIKPDTCPGLFTEKHYDQGGLTTPEQMAAAVAQGISYEVHEAKRKKEKSDKK